MRKVLFRVLIILLLALLFVLWVAFYQNKTPLSVLQGWFGVTNHEIIIDDKSWTINKNTTTDKTPEPQSGNNTTDSTVTTWFTISGEHTSNASPELTTEERQDTENLINSLFKR